MLTDVVFFADSEYAIYLLLKSDYLGEWGTSAELGTKNTWSGRIRNRKKAFLQFCFLWIKKKDVRLSSIFLKHIPLDSPSQDESNGIFVIFKLDRLHHKIGLFLKRAAIFYVNGRIRNKNTWSGRIRNWKKFNQFWPLLYCRRPPEWLANYFLTNFTSIDAEMFALFR